MLHSWQFNCPLHSLRLINIYAARWSLKSHGGGAKSCRQEMDPTPSTLHGEVRFGKSRGSGTKGDGKWQAALERLVVKVREGEMTICRGRGENRQQPQGAAL